ncbi:LacI family DNA-binding transcriptional regulator [Aeriscardovia aeriphila]|uniref:LacI family transcriptional regulator n=1 Tax=Aeriscardovia aeriphila TaxID=218139 RepID=A0A261FBC1_9BIFI|nr:LacI family DNA-binding transcriptional regulator [Aeriscardovia aeriphila]NYI25395.1 DNA-binding LacI/PurR family transcriptional regulator [Aeriscardovia aeriphila]OZG56451.1 LacI family transcriptional regulator [Aeriscardovia aeriphila]
MTKVTIKDVARESGVSTYTVSRALRGLDHVSEATRAHVIATAHKLNYTISRSASDLATGSTHRIAVLMREKISGWFAGELLDGLYDVLEAEGYNLLIYRAGDLQERSSVFSTLPSDHNADALIVTGFSPSQHEQEMLKRLGIPIVAVNSSDIDSADCSLAIDDIQGETMAIRYLASLGHRRFCYLGRLDPLPTWGRELRLEAYQQAMKELNLHDCGIFQADPNLQGSVATAIASMLASPVVPTAICAWADSHALAALSELRRNGLRLPDNISLIGFDGSTVARNLGLTTMSQPARDMGRKAARAALDLLNGEPPTERKLVIPAQLTPGTTTGPAPTSKSISYAN